MLSRPLVCWAADIAKVPLITALTRLYARQPLPAESLSARAELAILSCNGMHVIVS
jgi:hypothetical protein